jgi:hypothetical protein
VSAINFSAKWLIASFALCLTSCWTPPGKGAKAAAGYRAAVPVIDVLEKFRSEQNHYPATLDELVPNYLPDFKAFLVGNKVEPLHSPHAHAEASLYRPGDSSLDSFWYRRDNDSFGLMFRYAGPGMNSCSYDSKTKQWNAHGYY